MESLVLVLLREPLGVDSDGEHPVEGEEEDVDDQVLDQLGHRLVHGAEVGVASVFEDRGSVISLESGAEEEGFDLV